MKILINTENKLTKDQIIRISENLTDSIEKTKASLTSKFSVSNKSKIIITGNQITSKSLSCVYLINSLRSMNKSQVSKVSDHSQITFQFSGKISFYLIDTPLITNFNDHQF